MSTARFEHSNEKKVCICCACLGKRQRIKESWHPMDSPRKAKNMWAVCVSDCRVWVNERVCSGVCSCVRVCVNAVSAVDILHNDDWCEFVCEIVSI